MKIVLIRPREPRGESAILSHSAPMNLAYLAAYLMKHNYQVEIWDYEVEEFSPDVFIKRIALARPRLIGFSCLTPTIINGHRMAELVKENFPHILTLVGGSHSTAWPIKVLKDFPYFDLVVVGEGEETFLELCQVAEKNQGFKGVLGLACREGSHFCEAGRRPLIKNLDQLPFPSRDLLSLNFRRRGHISRGLSNYLKSTEIYTSRGCPIGCIFCAISVTMGKGVRFRSPANVLAEAEECLKQYNFDHLAIADDTFTLIPQRTMEICQGFKKLAVKSWHCEGTRVNAVSLELLKIMAKAGCQKVVFGVESGSPRILEMIGKKITVEQVKNGFKWARQAGIRFIEGNYIIGSHPSETVKDLEMTIDLIKETKPDFISATMIVPYPGTEIYNLMKEKNYIFTEDWEKFVMIDQLPLWRTDYFSPQELLKWQKKILRSFYLRPAYLLRILTKIKNKEEMRYFAEAGWEFIKWLVKGRLT